jgi:hypothetical protein
MVARIDHRVILVVSEAIMLLLIQEDTMKIYIVQFRQSGEDYEARAFRDKSSAIALAVAFLEDFVWNPEEFLSLSELEAHCADKDLAYINITMDII